MYDTRIRTTSALESNNNQLRLKIESGSNFFKFAQMLIREEAVKARGTPSKYRPVDRALDRSYAGCHHESEVATPKRKNEQWLTTVANICRHFSYREAMGK